ncbi:MAG: DUF3891 family protein, partial [Calditrichia bacterium]
ISFLYERRMGESSELDKFLEEQSSFRSRLRQELKISAAETQKAYDFMQWCDRLSLVLCQRNLPARERLLEISRGPDKENYNIRQNQDESVTVTPWPFESSSFTVTVEAAYLTELKFQDNKELAEALRKAPVKTLHWDFTKN